MMEDVVTTGLVRVRRSPRSAAPAARRSRAASLVDRSGGTADLGVPFFPLIRVDVPTYNAESLPPGAGGAARDQAGQPGRGMTGFPRLGVNIDHVATVRNARGAGYPDPVRAALLAAEAGADGITAHLREDRRHITDDDIARLSEQLTIPLNLEMAATDEMLAIALRHRPHAACIVPEKREERTTEGGLDAAGHSITCWRRWSASLARRRSACRCSSSPMRARSRRRCASARRWSSCTPGVMPSSRAKRRRRSCAA